MHAIAHTRGTRATIVRCTNNYGPRQHEEKAIPGWISAALASKPLLLHGEGAAIRDWLHVDDFAAGLASILERGTPGDIHHFSGHTPLTNRAVATRIAEMCGGAELKEVMDRPGQDARYALDDAATRDALDWSPLRCFEDGLAQTLNWMATHRSAA